MDNSDFLNLLEEAKKVNDFIELERLFLRTTNGKSLSSFDANEYSIVYLTFCTDTYLISTLTYDNLQAARRCHNMIMNMDKTNLKADINAALIASPPEITMLLYISQYDVLHNLMAIVLKDVNDPGNFDGEWYAKSFFNIMKHRPEPSTYEPKGKLSELSYFFMCKILLQRMNIKPEYRNKLNEIDEKYGLNKNGGGSGCMVALSIIAAVIVFLI